MKNDELLLKIQQNDAKAFKLVFKSLHPSLLAYVTTFTHNKQDAKDIVQNSFIILWNKRNELLPNSSLKSFLFTVAHNLYITEYRKKQVKLKVVEELKAEALNSRIEEDESIKEQRAVKLLGLIEQLPPKCKEILLLNKRDGVKYKEISNQLNISIKTVESQMRIAFTKIREGFKNDEFILFVFFKKFLSKVK